MNLDKVKSHWNERWQMVDAETPPTRSNYFISDYGRIKGVIKPTGKERLLTGSLNNVGQVKLNFRLVTGKRKHVVIHRFVAEHFIGKSEEDIKLNRNFVVHIDGNKLNNHFTNLKYLNQEELTAHHIKTGVINEERMRKSLGTKLNSTRVRLLKKKLKEGKTKKKVLARAFNITMMQVRRIEKGENWGYLD